MSDDRIFTSTLITSPTAGMFGPKTILGTTVKLNGSNYLLSTKAFRIFIGAQNKLTHLLESPPAATNHTYATWLFGDYCVVIWLLNNLEEKISDSVMFLTTAKEMWDILKVMYGNEKNLLSAFEIYKRLFELKHGDRYVPEFYGELKSLIDKLEMHQPAVTDAMTLKIYHQDFVVSKFLSDLNPSL